MNTKFRSILPYLTAAALFLCGALPVFADVAELPDDPEPARTGMLSKTAVSLILIVIIAVILLLLVIIKKRRSMPPQE